MRLLCKLGFHKYSNWGVKFSYSGLKYAFEYQQKKCNCCGLVKERRI